MEEREKVLLSSICIIALTGALVTAVSIAFLYRAAFDRERERLLDAVRLQGRIIGAIAEFDEEHSSGYPGGSGAATYRQIQNAYCGPQEAGKGGDFVVARREGNAIVLIQHSHGSGSPDEPRSIPISSDFAEPMRRALSGRSGLWIGPDTKGQTVLAAYEPVKALGVGLAAKTRLFEIQKPFIRAGTYAGAVILLLVGSGSLCLLFIMNPFIRGVAESEARYRLLVELSPDLVAVHTDGKLVYVNPAGVMLFGASSQESLIGKPVLDLVHPDFLDQTRSRVRQVLEEKRQTPLVEISIVGLDGHQSEVEVTGTFINYLGKPSVLLVMRDITKRKLADKEIDRLNQDLRSRIMELQTIFEVVPIGLAIAEDPRGLHIRGNPAHERMLGVPVGAELSKRKPESAHYQVFQEGRQLMVDELPMQRSVRGETVIGQVIDVVREDGSLVQLHCSSAPLFDEQGQPRGAVGAFLDVTELKQTERLLRKSLAEAEEGRHTLEALMEHVPEGITIAEAPDVKIRMVSRYGQDILGGSHDGLTARDVADQWQVFQEDGKTPMAFEDLPICRAVLRGEVEENVELTQINEKGQRLSLLCNAGPIRDRDGHILGGVVAWRDITELKQVRDALHESEQRYRRLFETMSEGFALHEIICDEEGFPCDYRFLEVNPAFEAQTGLKAEDLTGRTVRRVLPEIESLWIERYGRVALTGEPDRFEHWSKPLGRCYDVSVFRTEPGRFATVFLDITERKLAAVALGRSESRFRLLSKTAGRLLASPEPQGIVNELCLQVMEHLDCHVFFNFLLHEQAARLHLNAYAGIPEEEAKKIEWLDFGVAVCGCVAREGTRIIAEDILNTVDLRTELVKSYGVQAYACHPLMAQGRVIGTLSFGTKTRTCFTPEELALMKTVTDQVATAMERMRLIEELQKSRGELELRVRERTAELRKANEELRQVPSRLIAAQEEERKRLAGELHDSIGQTLAALKFGIETVLAARNRGDSEGALQHLERFIPNLQRAIDETRSIYTGLRPKILEEMGLLATLRWFCREFQGLYPEHHIELELELEEEEIPETLKIAIFRICQEALNNVAKHSKAEWVDVSLLNIENCVELVVADEGVGMDLSFISSSAYAKSLGLTGMRERAELTGGSFVIESTPGEGTRIRAAWPLEHSPHWLPGSTAS